MIALRNVEVSWYRVPDRVALTDCVANGFFFICHGNWKYLAIDSFDRVCRWGIFGILSAGCFQIYWTAVKRETLYNTDKSLLRPYIPMKYLSSPLETSAVFFYLYFLLWLVVFSIVFLSHWVTRCGSWEIANQIRRCNGWEASRCHVLAQLPDKWLNQPKYLLDIRDKWWCITGFRSVVFR